MRKKIKKPVENHQTAAWANVEQLKGEARVPIPATLEVDNAREWIEQNEK
ncbi:CDIF630_02480 family spore surface protein [Anaeromicrobium sediminis]|uniref:DUF3787 domain-containing protein n=1 Tax=Anaeromicrobium sediminis TaxID=1478221 RepID=A0A267MFQ6_9FIRM|nr:DUF3787 domain-containing protein [Anaeromicrobium sediminis]PAB58411.1 DUF3787 domain-containing protein [Anaeromicrobium sediminis]